MKKTLLITFALFAFYGFTQDRFDLEKKSDKTPSTDSIKKSKDQKILQETKVIYLLEGKEVTSAEFKGLKPETVKSVSVIRDKKEMSKYTSKNCDGLVVVELKKT